MTLDELLALVSPQDFCRQNNSFELPANTPHIRTDSRLVKAGDIFVAIEGTVYNGHNFIDQALANGAKYIVCRKNKSSIKPRASSIEIILVEDTAKAAAALAQASTGSPASKLTNLAVTGTNGKTTVAYLVRSVIQTAGQKCGLIGTIIYDTGLKSARAPLTTPDWFLLAENQSQMIKAGLRYVVIEASSHGLDQNRLAAINFTAAAFTNLADDHMDYHKTKKEYLAAKAKLFEALSPDATAVLNKQSSQAKYIAEKTKANLLWYAVEQKADIEARIESMDISKTRFLILDNRCSLSIEHRASSVEVTTPLLGRYNLSNHLAAAGLCLAAGFDLKTIANGLSALKVIPGRLEKVSCSSHESRATSHVFIDYAHTADALKNVLSTLKPLCKASLIVVFGCGGDRDKTKRPNMARVAEELADFVIVTSDNPRTEKPADIITDITAGFRNPNSERIVIQSDRKKAIELAIKTADKNDIVLIAGKGHEDKQIIADKQIDFNDNKIAQQFLKNRE